MREPTVSNNWNNPIFCYVIYELTDRSVNRNFFADVSGIPIKFLISIAMESPRRALKTGMYRWRGYRFINGYVRWPGYEFLNRVHNLTI